MKWLRKWHGDLPIRLTNHLCDYGPEMEGQGQWKSLGFFMCPNFIQISGDGATGQKISSLELSTEDHE